MITPKLKEAEWKAETLREKRKPLFKAYDAYKASVAYGDKEEDKATHARILAWHIAATNLDEEAISNPPEEIKYYL